MAAGACIIVEKYECRRTFFFFLSFFFLFGQFISLGPRDSSAKSVERMQRMHCLGTPSIDGHVLFCVGFKGRNEGDRVGKVQTPLSLCLSLDSYNPVEISPLSFCLS